MHSHISLHSTRNLLCWGCKKEKAIRDRTYIQNKVKWSRYRLGVGQREGRGIALLFHDRGTRRGWVVSSTPRPHFTPGKDKVPILQEAGWAPRPVWTGGKSRPHRDSIPDRPARSQSLYRLSYIYTKYFRVYNKAQILQRLCWIIRRIFQKVIRKYYSGHPSYLSLRIRFQHQKNFK